MMILEIFKYVLQVYGIIYQSKIYMNNLRGAR
jgi:hypothetical protein